MWLVLARMNKQKSNLDESEKIFKQYFSSFPMGGQKQIYHIIGAVAFTLSKQIFNATALLVVSIFHMGVISKKLSFFDCLAKTVAPQRFYSFGCI